LRADFNNTYKHMLDGSGFVQRFHFQKSGLKPPTSVGKDFNCAPQAL
jgi:hypothetical protein